MHRARNKSQLTNRGPLCWPGIGWLSLCFSLIASASDTVDYSRDIKPLLVKKCTACHGALKQKNGLRLDGGAFIRQGGKSGPAIDLVHPEQSLILGRVSTHDLSERMPPNEEGEALSEQQIRLLSEWIKAGARVSGEEEVLLDPSEHWAYQFLRRPKVPTISDDAWSHPIDAFVAHQQRELNLAPVDLADRHTLARRIYLNVSGLPPTPAQVASFANNRSVNAWIELVDSLLADPRYGERWGRHWMDVWRYSDWDGYKAQLRGSARHIWRWRDWIIESLNADKGYDRMIREMLAGDELAPEDPSVLRATGFLARNFHPKNRDIWLDATVEHTAKAFLGLTINCARCHDHKYDPIKQTAYYQFRAIFEPHGFRMDTVPTTRNIKLDGIPRVFDEKLAAETFLYASGDEKHPVKDKPMSPGLPAVLGGRFEIQTVALPISVTRPGLRKTETTAKLSALRSKVNAAKRALKAAGQTNAIALVKERRELGQQVAELELQSFEARLAADRAKYLEDVDRPTETRQEELAQEAADLERRWLIPARQLAVALQESALSKAKALKQSSKKKAAVTKAEKALADARKSLKDANNRIAAAQGKQAELLEYTPIGAVYPPTSTGRRLALAKWITSRNNPLTARVAVNQIWMRHFGSPLVDNVFDFGLRSPRPLHAEMLDWLAVELMENDWSMKHVHRLILTSRTWRLASSSGSSGVSNNSRLDLDNRYYWRMTPRRLEAEIVRDSVLSVSGQLDSRFGGADIDYRQGEESHRRSLYYQHAYEKQMQMLVTFDAASPNECYRRSTSIVPQQALALFNSSMAKDQSRKLAQQLWRETSSAKEQPGDRFVLSAFQKILSRPPSEEELEACLIFLDTQTDLLRDPSRLTAFQGGVEATGLPSEDPRQRAQENLVHALINHNDFVTVR